MHKTSPSAAPVSFRTFSASASIRQRAFTLVELLAVVAIMLLMMALVVPVFNGMKNAGDVTKAAYDISGMLDQARAYAISNNTYVWVGFAEVDSSYAASVVPQITATSATPSVNPYGRVAVAAVASKDGTRGYDVTSFGSTNNIANAISVWNTAHPSGAGLVALGKLQRFENLHLAILNGAGITVPTTGAMARPSIGSPIYSIGQMAAFGTNGASVTAFAWPLGTPLNTASGGAAQNSTQYQFNRVLYFDPQGVARVQTFSNTDTIVTYMEIDLQQTQGNATPAPIANQNIGNQVAIQIDCMTGTNRIYRP